MNDPVEEQLARALGKEAFRAFRFAWDSWFYKRLQIENSFPSPKRADNPHHFLKVLREEYL